MAVITLTTDFGTRDWFVGTMKGVILSINPRVRIVDLTHEIPMGDIRAGAYALTCAYQYFPPGTIHVAVVDPGVGSPRGALLVKTPRHIFIGPDNGVLSWAVRKERVLQVRRLDNPKYFLRSVSATFHGRDVFAPVAAHASKGVAASAFGPAITDYVQLPWPEAVQVGNGIHGEVVYIDGFGNAITNLAVGLLDAEKSEEPLVLLGKKRIPVRPFYAAVPPGQPAAVRGSSGFLELAVRGGNASRVFRLRAGSPVTLHKPK